MEETWRCVPCKISSPWQAGSGLSPWRPRFLGCSRAGPGKCHMGLRSLWGGQSALAPLLGIIWIVSATVGLPDSYWFFGSMFAIVAVLAGVAASGVAAFYIVEWLKAVFTNPHAALAIEEKVHYDTKGAAASRMLVIRGVDDEASLSLAAGSIGSRLSYLVLVGAIPALVTMAMFLFFLSELFEWAVNVLLGIMMLCSYLGALIFFFVPGVFKSFFGREFLVNALVCDISVDSAPDT